MNYCITSSTAEASRMNGKGTLRLCNVYGVNVSDEGLINVYAVYMAEVLKAKEKMNVVD